MSHHRWRLIRSGALNGAENMALDEALLEAVAAGRSRPVLRLYRWDSPTVTLGYGQRGRHAVNLAACRDLGLDVVRRATGGRAVLHDQEATYAVISPERSDLFPGGILENYRRIAEVLQQTLASLGIESSMSPGRSRGAGAGEVSGVCFAAPSAYELVFRGCKVTGSAQKRQGNAFLQHGSIPVDLNLAHLYRALNPGTSVPDAGIRHLLASVGWLNRWLEHPVGIRNVEDRLIESFRFSWDIALEEDCPTPEERARASALCREKYVNSRWNLQGIA